LLAEKDRLSRQPVDVEHVLGETRVEAVRDFGDPCRLESPANAIRRETQPARDAGAGHFRRQVACEPMTTNPYDILGLPLPGQVPEAAKLEGQELGLLRDEVDVGVDSSDEAPGNRLGVLAVRLPLL